MAQTVPVVVVLFAALIAAVTDVWKFKVYNVLTFPLLLAGVLYHWVNWGGFGVLNSLLGIVIGAGILFVFHLLGGIGRGDVKLMAALGAWLGIPLTLLVFIASALAAGIYALVLLVMFGSLRETMVNFQIIWYRIAAVGKHFAAEDRVENHVTRSDRRRRVIPFAAMVAIGLIALFIWSWLDNLPLGASFR